eukprot:42478-Pelagomonas_calceolata.AAC.1
MQPATACVIPVPSLQDCAPLPVPHRGGVSKGKLHSPTNQFTRSTKAYQVRALASLFPFGVHPRFS